MMCNHNIKIFQIYEIKYKFVCIKLVDSLISYKVDY